MYDPCKNCSNRKCANSVLGGCWDRCVDSKFTLFPQMKSQKMSRKRFEGILMSVRFPRNLVGLVCKAAIRDFGSYGNAYEYSTLKMMHRKANAPDGAENAQEGQG